VHLYFQFGRTGLYQYTRSGAGSTSSCGYMSRVDLAVKPAACYNKCLFLSIQKVQKRILKHDHFDEVYARDFAQVFQPSRSLEFFLVRFCEPGGRKTKALISRKS
jgi:hypothetical protein